MFGLEEQKKKKKNEEFFFELEKELKTAKKNKEIKALVEKRIQTIKETLRVGEDEGKFDQLGVLLHGYTSFLKVISRFSSK